MPQRVTAGQQRLWTHLVGGLRCTQLAKLMLGGAPPRVADIDESKLDAAVRSRSLCHACGTPGTQPVAPPYLWRSRAAFTAALTGSGVPHGASHAAERVRCACAAGGVWVHTHTHTVTQASSGCVGYNSKDMAATQQIKADTGGGAPPQQCTSRSPLAPTGGVAWWLEGRCSRQAFRQAFRQGCLIRHPAITQWIVLRALRAHYVPHTVASTGVYAVVDFVGSEQSYAFAQVRTAQHSTAQHSTAQQPHSSRTGGLRCPQLCVWFCFASSQQRMCYTLHMCV